MAPASWARRRPGFPAPSGRVVPPGDLGAWGREAAADTAENRPPASRTGGPPSCRTGGFICRRRLRRPVWGQRSRREVAPPAGARFIYRHFLRETRTCGIARPAWAPGRITQRAGVRARRPVSPAPAHVTEGRRREDSPMRTSPKKEVAKGPFARPPHSGGSHGCQES